MRKGFYIENKGNTFTSGEVVCLEMLLNGSEIPEFLNESRATLYEKFRGESTTKAIALLFKYGLVKSADSEIKL